MIKTIKEFADKFEVKMRANLVLRPGAYGDYTFEEYGHVKEQLKQEGYELNRDGERIVSTYDFKETWSAHYEKDGFVIIVWYKKFQNKAERCAELRKQMEELGCDE